MQEKLEILIFMLLVKSPRKKACLNCCLGKDIDIGKAYKTNNRSHLILVILFNNKIINMLPTILLELFFLRQALGWRVTSYPTALALGVKCQVPIIIFIYVRN